jgi:hypothetical protein
MISSAIASGSENSFGINYRPGCDWKPAPGIGRWPQRSYSVFASDIRLSRQNLSPPNRLTTMNRAATGNPSLSTGANPAPIMPGIFTAGRARSVD